MLTNAIVPVGCKDSQGDDIELDLAAGLSLQPHSNGTHQDIVAEGCRHMAAHWPYRKPEDDCLAINLSFVDTASAEGHSFHTMHATDA